jgi:hypothetical protein
VSFHPYISPAPKSASVRVNFAEVCNVRKKRPAADDTKALVGNTQRAVLQSCVLFDVLLRLIAQDRAKKGERISTLGKGKAVNVSTDLEEAFDYQYAYPDSKDSALFIYCRRKGLFRLAH